MPILKAEIHLEEVGIGDVYNAMLSISETESVLLDYDLPNGNTDLPIPQSFVTGITNPYVVLIRSDKDVSWRLNVADTAVPLKANGFAMLYKTDITALLMTNASGATANIKIWLTGIA